nr:hypothetical protein BaRGS_013794 [Batillaria attramentaria]
MQVLAIRLRIAIPWLSSLYETRPPVSRAKMASVTKHAIKAIKFYKHVSRVIRVLNLWQKNAVFPMEVIQPLLDLAADPNNVDLVLAAQRAVEKVVSTHQRIVAKASNGGTEENLIAQQSDIVNTVTKLLQQTGEGSLLAAGQESQIQQLQLLQQQLMMQTEMMSSKPQQTAPVLDNNLLAQIKLLTDQLLSKTSDSPPTSGAQASGGQNSGATACVGASGDSNMGSANKRSEPGFNKKLLDFDYGDSDDDEDNKGVNSNVQGLPGGVHKLLSDPAIMQHINKVSSTLQKSEQQMSTQELLRKQHLEQQQEEFNKEIAQGSYKGFGQQDVIVVEDQDDERDRERDYDRDRRRSRRSRDRSRSPRRRRHSRSRSRERRRSRDRHRRSRSRDHDRERQREKDRERKKKGLPPIKDKCISVCTRTLWFGHLAKHTTEDELRAEIEKYGPVETINMVPPRGCAFVCMARRKEAAKALDRMKGFKLNSSALRVAWAPGVGVKESNFRDLWDVELGVTYIPWNKLPGDISPLLEGAIIDEDSLPEHLKGSLFGQQDQGEDVDHRTGVRLPTFPGQEREMEEPKEWPADDKMLEEEALAEMEEDIDHRMGMGGDAGKGPTPLMSLPMMGMRMHLPGPGGPRMQMQVAGGAPRPGMMLEVNRPETSLAMGPGGAFSPGMARPGLLGGPRMMRPGMPQEGAEGVMRSPLPGGIMGAQGGPAMGLCRLGMGAQGPGSLPLGQRDARDVWQSRTQRHRR